MTTTGQSVARARPLALLTLASRVLGLLRECVFGYYFGTGELLSAFRIAFMLPNLARRLFGEGALSAAAIPVLTDALQRRGRNEAVRFAGALLAKLAIFLVGLVASIEVVVIVLGRYSDDTALHLAAILMPYMAMICLVAVAGGMLQVLDRFVVPALAPIVMNGVVVLTVYIGAEAMGAAEYQLMVVACVGVLLSGVLQLALMGTTLRTAEFWPRLRLTSDPDVARVMKLMAPMMLGLSAVQINALGDYLIAYFFVVQDGARIGPAVLGFAQYLYQLPLGVFGIALATVLFPALSRKASDDDLDGVADVLQRGLRLTLFIALPAAAGLIFIAPELVAALYERGEFDAQSTQRVSATLRMYSIGLPAYFANHLLVRAFYAIKDSATPARIAVAMVGANLVLNLALVPFMEERGLALATAICAFGQTVWLSQMLRRHIRNHTSIRSLRAVARPGLAVIVMVAALYGIRAAVLQSARVADSELFQLAIYVPVGTVTYAAAASLLRVRELRLLLSRSQALESQED